ncbi:HAD family hydrolase, partial [Streptomyces mirabilis]|nr:HAD family hydrolase [Streptomyces mirabilis]
ARTHGVIVKRLPALHDLGAIDVLCVDKTGTLTQDRPVVDRALDADGEDAPEVLRRAAAAAWWTPQLADLPAPDALDEALLQTADEDDLTAYDGIAALPFDPVRRLTTAVVRTPAPSAPTPPGQGRRRSRTGRCALDPQERAAARPRPRADGRRAARPGGRHRRTPRPPPRLHPGRRTRPDLRGFVTLRDALVPSAAEALRVLADRGVAVRVLTGDHPGTAARACRDLGLDPGGTHRRRTRRSHGRRTRRTRRPHHRLRPLHARAQGAYHRRTARPRTRHRLPRRRRQRPAALHAADVGICPRDATDLARESADVVLADKDLTAISHAITAGRYSSGNIGTYLRVTLSSNLGNVIAMLAAGILLPFLPMLPTQVLVQNMCFDAAQLAFAYDRPAPGTLKCPTVLRSRDLLGFIIGFGLLNAVADLATFGVLALAVHGPGTANDESVFHSGWFTENLLTQALVMLLLRLGRRALEGRQASRSRRLGRDRPHQSPASRCRSPRSARRWA